MSTRDDDRGAGRGAQVLERARRTTERLDGFQRRHTAAAVPVAVIRKFTEDRTFGLASTIAFWAIFSIFPLLLVFATVLGYLLPTTAQQDVLRHLGLLFPVLAPSSRTISGPPWALVVGIVTALWSGSSVVVYLQEAFDQVWEVPYAERRTLVGRLRRGLIAVLAIGLGLVFSTLISGVLTSVATGLGLAWSTRLLGFAISIVLDVGLFIAAFRILTSRTIVTRQVLPGALLSGLVFWVLQQLSSLLISRYLLHAGRIYGSFATVVTILWWCYLQSLVTLLGAQLNVVLVERLYPRSLVGGPTTHADRRALESYARKRAYDADDGQPPRILPPG